ncbi:hypothetical protein SAMN05216466_101191 [Paraburkholderia phenazinium]|uniref:Uncharacterized protein n=1 Tax=Paraburkholderia phenazinium TaxID=60549 RepID=A0A1G7P7Z6_9BURK|nr:hypothetical protein [Paraburkholderia phenazinium]SDF82446.1 hypothetical protein SAMN05216466_101191 [Paraburkholderia phenazinium]
MLAGTVAHAPETSPWSRARINELIDTLLALAVVHGFEQSDALGEMLASGISSKRIWTIAEIAFIEVPLSEILDAIRRTRLYTDLQDPT